MLSWEYPPVVQGGLARHVGKLSEALVERGVEVQVLTRAAPGTAAGREEREGVVVHRVSAPAFPLDDLDGFLAWVRALNDELLAAGRDLDGVEAVHAHDWLVGRAGEALADAAGVPFLATIHATEHGRHAGRVSAPPQSTIHALERRVARRAQRVLVCSGFMRRHVTEVFELDARRVAVIPNGVDPADLPAVDEPAALRGRFAAPDEPLVLLAGRLVHEKGFDVALEALREVVAHVDRVRFLVAGDGPEAAGLRARARDLGLEARGVFLGWADDQALAALYRVADVCLVPSRFEPFGLVALEAMACGCPCVVADTGGLREVVPDGVGLRVAPEDPGELALAIARVLADADLRARLARAGREHVRAFDWPEAARRTAGLYREQVGAWAGARDRVSRR